MGGAVFDRGSSSGSILKSNPRIWLSFAANRVVEGESHPTSRAASPEMFLTASLDIGAAGVRRSLRRNRND